jgi:asparagine synthase (glutamine-hydrolyzing)
MSAITGIFYRNKQKVTPKLIKNMNNMLSHRGPDGSAVWYDGSVALGHQMLWTTPESLHEKLPFEDDDSMLVITADARIDNRDELSKELNIENKEEISDSYFIMKAYSKWGENCPEHLLGDFAFVIWDKNNEKLFCARDHMGVKPFYYYLSEEVFVFGTEIKALFCIHEVPRKLNELKVAHHLIPIFTDREITFYEDIHRLPAAHKFIITNDSNIITDYWKLDPDLEFSANSDEEYYEKFREVFSESVRCRLRSNYEIGFELSGGIDSSSVICTAKKLCDNSLNSFSLIFNKIKKVDESYYIQKVIDTGSINPHFLVGDSISPFKEMEKIFFFQEEPPSTPNSSIIWELYKKMNENDVRIVIGGHDGDCAFYKGENYFRELFVKLNWIKLIKEINGYSKRKEQKVFNIFIEHVIFSIIPKTSEIWSRYKGIRQEKDFSFINDEFEQRFNLKKHFKDIELTPFKEANTSKKTHYYYLTLATHQYIFEMMDKYAGAFGIEPRHPIMDKRLVELCYAVPSEVKFSKGWDRMLARVGLADILPEEVQWRVKKVDFFPIFERNLLLFEKDRLDDLMEGEELNNYIKTEEVKKIYERFKDGNRGADPIDVWKIAILSMWLKYNSNSLSKES